MESETPKQEPKMNREKVGQDLKLQWNQMMDEFEQSSKKQFTGFTSLCFDSRFQNN